MEERVHPLIDQTRFVKELLALYKEYPVLWDKNHPHYRNRGERCEAVDVLLQKCREFYPEADEDFVKLKIDSLRACFRKEWNKVCLSKASAERPEDVHKPSLWYYNLLLYTVGEECSDDEVKPQDNLRVSFWTREYTTALINLLKKQPYLYASDKPNNLAKRNAAVRKIVQDMNLMTGKLFTVEDVRKKIQLLKGQYRYECRKIKRSKRLHSKSLYKPNLWCFDMLNFLKGHVHLYRNKSSSNSLRGNGQGNSDTLSSDFEDMQDVKEEMESDDDMFNMQLRSDSLNNADMGNDDFDDIFDTIGKNVARKLRDMSDSQRVYAERLINEITYHGQMENLTPTTKLIQGS
ncbi:hypothetical protein NQ315_007657 [Exocentrus adspersus]|uniref:MADF domain-containing protein n=1 Tax=Exocentrus adspersus TaxID=1586481 RepID=A0AAV8W985_9CUCU|nr:hypothetical protein NQ315_007657 [Exocentrus adspersus]